MQYALLIYGPDNDLADRRSGRSTPPSPRCWPAPNVTGWARLHAAESATTVSARRAGRC